MSCVSHFVFTQANGVPYCLIKYLGCKGVNMIIKVVVRVLQSININKSVQPLHVKLCSGHETKLSITIIQRKDSVSMAISRHTVVCRAAQEAGA